MHRNTANYTIENVEVFRSKMLNWANRFNIFCLLDNCGYESSKPTFDCLLAVGSCREIVIQGELESLQSFIDKQADWMFAHMSYEMLSFKANKDLLGFDKGFFFTPITVLQFQGNTLRVETFEDNPEEVYASILQQKVNDSIDFNFTYKEKSEPSHEDYVLKIKAIQHHIQQGDCYELNYCNQYFFSDAEINPIKTYQRLLEISPAPFSSLYKNNNTYCLCSSPERYIKKIGDTIISQPIKGTSRRNTEDVLADAANKNDLLQSEKERSENVMVVDLVRNDLSRVCAPGSVYVSELFGIYSFPTVHQMISTVQGILKKSATFSDIIKATFPMGSMTGAPKNKVMELIEKYEEHPRGLFSGSIGYIKPNGDFDFNVVIRSIFYNKAKKLVSYAAGGGITINSDPEKEWEESLLKLKAVEEVLGFQA